MLLALTLCACATVASAQDFKLVRSLSGPSGTVSGPHFVVDGVRTRFVYPRDKAFVVYFQWDAPPGNHTLTAYWKQPDGRTAAISPDVKVESATRELSCYWTYQIPPEMLPGVWQVDVRIDGQPAGSHNFEIAGTAAPSAQPEVNIAPKPPTLDELFGKLSPSLVWVRRFDASGHRADTGTGFVTGKDRILTALQVVDGASRLEVEFPGGRKVETNALLAFSRKGDWAMLAVDTGTVPALTPGSPAAVKVGQRLIVFTCENGTRSIGGIDITGRQTVPNFGDRIQFAPTLPLEAAGGPLLDDFGRVTGILGGAAVAGSRFASQRMSVSPGLGMSLYTLNAAAPLSVIPRDLPDQPTPLTELVAAKALIEPAVDIDLVNYVSTAREMPKTVNEALPRDVSEFSRQDKLIWVISEWRKKGKGVKGLMAARVWDEQNRLRVVVPAKKLSLTESQSRTGFAITATDLTPGLYRIDLLWDSQPVWRTFFRLTD